MAHVRVKRFPDDQDMFLIFLVLGLSFFVLRSNGWKAERKPILVPIGSSAAMDGLWRDSVRPLKEADMRPRADPDMIWDEPRYEHNFPKPTPQAPLKTAIRESTPEPEPYFPTPRPVPKEVFKRPTISPQRISFADSNSSARTKAFLKNPEEEKKTRARGY